MAITRVPSARYLDANLSGTDSEHVRAVRARTSIWELVRCLFNREKQEKRSRRKHSRFPTVDQRDRARWAEKSYKVARSLDENVMQTSRTTSRLAT